MGSLLIATGVLMYTWISGVHYSFLRRRGVSLHSSSDYSPDILFKALIWPLLHLTPEYESTPQDLVE